jgi:hypothetical protein
VGVPEHFKILALEEMESLYVREKMRRLYEVKHRLAERAKGRDAYVTLPKSE